MKKLPVYNSTKRILEESTKNAYNMYASKFAETRNGKVHWEEFEVLIPLLAKKPLNVLDIGCGSGRFFSYLEKHADISHYTGIDYSTELLKEAKVKAGFRDKLEWIEGDMLNFKVEEGKYDLIVLIASFHHLLNPEEHKLFLKKLYDSLKPEGILFMTNWNLLELPFYADRQIEKTSIFEIPLSDGKDKAENRYYYGFELKEIEHLFENAGFIKSSHTLSEKNKRNIISVAYKS
ncbi:MAG: class I SAM-dependent methyltransferase [Candidatus Gracilibacteria bacterium]